jgi:CheY-like chemotaxis protein
MTKILLVDDDQTMISLLKTLLGLEGYQVATLMDKTGDILQNIRAAKPDILMIDIFLGDCNGLDMTRRIRQSSDLKNIKIIMVSGIDKEEECLSAGADAFLLKPYMPNELFGILRA